ncbi:MAG: histone H1 [Acidobacteriota bacterium]
MPERSKDTFHGYKTGKRGQGPPDPNVRAGEIVQQATREMPKEGPDESKDPKRVAVGRMGGLKGGEARKAALTQERRAEIAKKRLRSVGEAASLSE